MKAAIIVLAVILTLPGVPVWAQDDPPCTNGDCPPDDPPCTNGDCPPDDPPCTNGDCPPDDPPCTNGDCPPDDDTPANEGVCDDLKWATPGLYGLCIAFCEAQDCEPDITLEDPLDNCKPSSKKLLRNYRRKMQTGDPDMPCLRQPCPCWTQEELDALRYPGESGDPNERSFCAENNDPQAVLINYDVWGLNNVANPLPENFFAILVGTAEYYTPTDGPTCRFGHIDTEAGINKILGWVPISADEYLTCAEQVISSAADRFPDCVLD